MISQKSSKELEQSYFSVIQKGLSHFAGTGFIEEVQDAKLKFFQPLSIPEESSPLYEARMSQFFDWYFFTRPLNGYRHTPLESLFDPRELRFETGEGLLIEDMRNHRHSLFEFIKKKGDDILIKDLFKNEKLTISTPNFNFGLRSDEIFEARLIPVKNHSKDNWVFMRGFCFHPLEARKYILGEVKSHRKDPDLNPEDLMLKLAKMNMRTDQYKHVPIAKIYSDEMVLR